MLHKKKKFLSVLVLLTIATALFITFSANHKKAAIPPLPAPTHKETDTKNSENPPPFTTEIHFGKTTLTALRGGDRAWDLDAVKVQMDEKNNKAVAFNVNGLFYSDKKPKANVISSGADIDMKSKDILFHGEVQITTAKGEKAWSRFMRWDGASQRLIGWDGVKVWRNNTLILGTTMEVDPSFSQITIKGDVSSFFTPKQTKSPIN